MKQKLIGHVPVDSGQIIIVDPWYVLTGLPYERVVETTLKNTYGKVLFSGKAGNGFATQTNSGDGVYPVYAEYDKNGRPSKIIIDFLA